MQALLKTACILIFSSAALNLDCAKDLTTRLLIQATMSGDLEQVKQAQQDGGDINNKSVIVNAISFGHLEIVKYLRESGVNFNIKDACDLARASNYHNIVAYPGGNNTEEIVFDTCAQKWAGLGFQPPIIVGPNMIYDGSTGTARNIYEPDDTCAAKYRY